MSKAPSPTGWWGTGKGCITSTNFKKEKVARRIRFRIARMSFATGEQRLPNGASIVMDWFCAFTILLSQLRCGFNLWGGWW